MGQQQRVEHVDARQEDIMVVCANRTHVMVATSNHFLRIFSISGVQTQLLLIPGPVVTMAIHDAQLILIYNQAGGFDNCQCFGVVHFHLFKNCWKMINDYPLTLRQHLQLVWFGFSTQGSPAFVDSSGNVFLWQRQQSLWIPICNTRKAVKKSDNFWLIGIEETETKLRGIICRSASFPATLPRPIPTTIPFDLPLCETKSEKSTKEHELLSTEMVVSNVQTNSRLLTASHVDDTNLLEKKQLQLLIQLFALACKCDRDFRAVEICSLMPNVESIGLAIQYASKMRRMNLAKKLDELARSKAADAEHEVDAEEDLEESFCLSGDEEFFNVDQLEVQKPATCIRPSSETLLRVPTVEDPDECDQSSENINDEETTPNSLKQKTPVKTTIRTEETQLVNPFKVGISDNGTSSLMRATSRFEQLENERRHVAHKKDEMKTKRPANQTRTFKLPKKNPATVVSKGSVVDEKKMEQKAKLSGFQLFLKENHVNADDDLVTQVMKEWKELSASEKKMWNNKAADVNIKSKYDDKNKPTNKVLKEKNFKPQTIDKLNSFAFKKSES